MLLDTSGLLCLLHRAEPFHEHAVAAYRAASIRMTTNYVLAEFVTLAHVRGLPRPASLAFAADLSARSGVETVWVSESLHESLRRRALALLQARLDKTYSLCDAVSFVLMRQRGIAEALTTDRHFEQEKFRRLLVYR